MSLKRFLFKSNPIYRIYCFFKRYTTIKSRYLDHTFYDDVTLLPFTMFEILSRFLDIECDLQKDYTVGPKCNTVWHDIIVKEKGSKHEEWIAHRIKVNGKEKLVIDEMIDLYKWWELEYIPFWQHRHPKSIKFDRMINKYRDQRPFKEQWIPTEDGFMKWDFQPTDKKKHSYWVNKSIKFDEKMDTDLEKNMIRLVRLKNYLWT